MTVTRTPRLALVRWSSDSDVWSREDLVETIDRLEAQVATLDQLAGYAPTASPAMTGTPTVDGDPVATATDLAGYAPTASPTFTGTTTIAVLDHDGTLAGFFGTAPVARPGTYTLTGVPDRTLGAHTPDPEAAVYVAVPADLAQAATLAELNQLRAAYENLRARVEDLAGVTVATATDLRTLGLLG